MDEPKVRKPRADKGISRGPRIQTRATPAPAPVNVRIVLRNGVTSEFGAANHFVENGSMCSPIPASGIGTVRRAGNSQSQKSWRSRSRLLGPPTT